MNEFEKLTTLAAEKVACAIGEIADLQAAILSEKRLLKVACAGVIFFALVDIGIVYHFGSAIGASGSAAEAPSWTDQLARLTASLMLFVAVSAATFMAAHALDQRVQRGSRMAAGALSAAFAVGAFVVAAAIGWPAFGPAVDGLVGGESVASGMSASGAAAATPLWVRLSMASVVVAAGVLGGVCELAAAAAFTRLRNLQAKLGWPQHVAELGRAALAASEQATHAQTAIALASSQDQQHAHVRTGLSQAVDAYATEASRGRHGALNARHETRRTTNQRAALERARGDLLLAARAAGEAIPMLLDKQRPDQNPPALSDTSRPATPDAWHGGSTGSTT